jgi:hypothetical protein
MEHRQSNPHGQFRQEVNVFGASAQAKFLSHVLSAYQSHTCILILFSLLLHCLPSGLFPKGFALLHAYLGTQKRRRRISMVYDELAGSANRLTEIFWKYNVSNLDFFMPYLIMLVI